MDLSEKENAYSLVYNMWNVHTRPTRASDFSIVLVLFMAKKLKWRVLDNLDKNVQE
jgi:hypothetical protein